MKKGPKHKVGDLVKLACDQPGEEKWADRVFRVSRVTEHTFEATESHEAFCGYWHSIEVPDDIPDNEGGEYLRTRAFYFYQLRPL